MTTHVVLFNLETNNYLSSTSPLKLVMDWRDAKKYKAEILAVTELRDLQKVSQENNLRNWCTRTFYSL